MQMGEAAWQYDFDVLEGKTTPQQQEPRFEMLLNQ